MSKTRKLKAAFPIDDETVDQYARDLNCHIYHSESFLTPVVISGGCAGRTVGNSGLAKMADIACPEGALGIAKKR